MCVCHNKLVNGSRALVFSAVAPFGRPPFNLRLASNNGDDMVDDVARVLTLVLRKISIPFLQDTLWR